MVRDHFRVVFDGPAVEDGEMDVSQLASSLLALGKLIENADAIRTGEAGRVKVRVNADVKRGSFDVGIALHWIDGIKDAAIAWAMTPEGAGTLALLGILGFSVKDITIAGGKGVIQVVRWLRGRTIRERIELRDGNTRIIVEDGDALEVDATVARMVEEPSIRQPLERFTEPLRDDGVDRIRFEDQSGTVVEHIEASEAAAFAAAAGPAPTSSATFQATYQIRRLFFERGRKWRLSNGAQTIQAEIEDEEFWAKVESSQMSFAKDDYLVCSVRMDQWLTSGGLRTEYIIERVEDHISAPKQTSFSGL
ncbi:MAG: hypothetical protein IH998_06205 [Proteobacteria bacterium]|nr:hypothetical protein [Pseudomonadota bacterium]